MKRLGGVGNVGTRKGFMMVGRRFRGVESVGLEMVERNRRFCKF